MSEEKDIVERLITAFDGDHDDDCNSRRNVCSCDFDENIMVVVEDAAVAIQRLRGEVERLREAARPFADIGQWLFARDIPDDTPLVLIEGIIGGRGALTRGDFKAAHIALSKLSEGE